MLAQYSCRLLLLRNTDKVSCLVLRRGFTMRKIESKSTFFPPNAPAQRFAKFRADQKRGFALVKDRSCGRRVIVFELELLASTYVEFGSNGNQPIFGFNRHQHVIYSPFLTMPGRKCNEFERSGRAFDQGVDDRNTRILDPLPGDFVILKTSERELNHSCEVFHSNQQRFGKTIAQIAGLADD